MNDLISKRALYDKCVELEQEALKMVLTTDDKIEKQIWNAVLTERSAFKFSVMDALASLNNSSAELDNQVHLCGFCKYDYPECPAGMSDIIFGNGKEQDNVCACAKFEIKLERKRGEWLKEDLSGYLTPGGNSIYHCSECGYTEGPWPHPRLTNFCPSCGADMRGEYE